MSETTLDDFLGGRLTIAQPGAGYRAGMDPVLMAAAVDARPGQTVLDLGTGAGTALLCLMHRVGGLSAVGVERQAEVAELARGNGDRNGLPFEVVAADITALPPNLRGRSFDHVLMNPPWFDRRSSHAAAVPGREAGRGVDTPLSLWVDCAIRRLVPGGQLTAILKPAALAWLLSDIGERLGDIALQPFAPRTGRPAGVVIVTGRKNARGELRLMPPVVLHDGTTHDGDRDSYSAAARAVLRDGKSLAEARLIGP